MMEVETGTVTRAKLQSDQNQQHTNTVLCLHTPILLPNQRCQSIDGNKKEAQTNIGNAKVMTITTVITKHTSNQRRGKQDCEL